MIVSGGENVFPSEIEEALLKHPAVRDAAAVGVDDERFGQRVRAYVVAEGVDEDALEEHVRATLARYTSHARWCSWTSRSGGLQWPRRGGLIWPHRRRFLVVC